MLPKISAIFYVFVLTDNALQQLSFFIFFFSPIFWTNMQRFFPDLFSMLLDEVRGSEIGPWTHLKISVCGFCQVFGLQVFVQNACAQLKHKQTLKHARKMHAAMQRAAEEGSSIEVKNAVISQLIIWFMEDISYE